MSIALIFLVISMANRYFVKKNSSEEEKYYKNELSQKINKNDISGINYDYIVNDLENIDKILKEQLAQVEDINKKTSYYYQSQNIYNNKINEIVMILNEKLDDEDFERLNEDLNEFYKNLDYATDEIKKTNTSTIDSSYYTYKYYYEEKQGKCKDLINTYKGFLN